MLLCVVTSVPVGLWCICCYFWNPAPGDISQSLRSSRELFYPYLNTEPEHTMFTHAAVCSHTQPGMCVYMCAHPRARTHTQTHIHMHVYVRACLCMRVCVCMLVCVCMPVCDSLTLGARNREDLFTTHLGREPAEEERKR